MTLVLDKVTTHIKRIGPSEKKKLSQSKLMFKPNLLTKQVKTIIMYLLTFF